MALIARALTQEPELILMDEPTANLDYGNQVRVLKVIRQLSESGLGVLMTSHDPDHAFLLATRAVLLTRERKLLKGSVDEESLRDEGPDRRGGGGRGADPRLCPEPKTDVNKCKSKQM